VYSSRRFLVGLVVFLLILTCVLAIALNSGVFSISTKEQDADLHFWIQNGWITINGDCNTLSWQVEGIQRIYIDNFGIPGKGISQYCPDHKDVHLFKVILKNGDERLYQLDTRAAFLGIKVLGLAIFLLVVNALMRFYVRVHYPATAAFLMRWLRRTAVLGAFLIVGFICAELIARAWSDAHPPQTYADYLLKPSPAYADAPYWSDNFLQELRAWQAHFAPTNFVGTYHSALFNEVDGLRQIAYQPATAPTTIYLVGASPIYNAELPDDQIIASQLQARLNGFASGAYRVVAVATNGATLSTELAMLKGVSLKRGDIVIFYAGTQEITGVYWPFVRQRSHLLYEKPCWWLLDIFHQQSALITALCSWVNDDIPQELLNSEKLKTLIASTAQGYYSTLISAYAYTTAHGATFFHVMEPHLWTRPLSPAEEQLAANRDLVQDKVGEMFKLMWPELQAAAVNAQRQGVRTLDLTHALDNLRSHDVVFFDSVHINQRGNAIIAASLFDLVITV
jgi:hypothetical protein